ncbi:ribose transport system substrate-binding protein [Pullulanibacillus pueri]|uniref:Periplasmic binding protein domain-containing protein n=1 Tax=Pullulanibacillus pueri TaxID=1437324 RepID=A0A8J3EKS1_9BACL|nr:sugar-binding protein [Pullulanibacillus pueri]MBM7680756.1 ribose transport system substrate-binding protein [Pullulanibacillus pueri]GGH78211.1 hypothetical protein GCM10007096_11290 [Pullulanibacillus pueri]
MKVRKVIVFLLVISFIATFSLSLYFYLKAFNFDTRLTTDRKIKEPQYHFILIPEEMDNPYWHLVEKGAKAAGSEIGAAVEYSGPIQTNVEAHINEIDTAIASKVDGIITQGIGSKNMTAIINKAIQKGIPVITIDSDDSDSRRNAYIGTDNYSAGYMAGKALIKAMGGKAEVGVVTGNFESANEKERVAGFKKAVAEAPHVHIADIQESHITRVQAAEVAYNMVVKHPKINAFFGTSALDGIGISAIVQQLDLKKGIFIMAFDTLDETQNLMKKGYIDATISQEPYQMGYESVNMMVDLLKGKQVKAVNHTRTQVITAKDLPIKAAFSNRGVPND